ncbi:hypothetical protein OG413_28565 [Streptomyces sp. NBC_01433]|nr:hypothetical protein [Streptomyces sp. NBC_01433]
MTEYTVVRVGNSVASFTKLSVAGHHVPVVPCRMIAKQISRLQETQI